MSEKQNIRTAWCVTGLFCYSKLQWCCDWFHQMRRGREMVQLSALSGMLDKFQFKGGKYKCIWNSNLNECKF